jgi:hypothetical protein
MAMTKNPSILRKIRYANLFIEIRENISRQKFSKARSRFVRLAKLYGESGPSSILPIEANIIYGLISWNEKEYHGVYYSCRIALDQIGSRLNRDLDENAKNDLRYLRAYCKNLVAFANSDSDSIGNFDFSDLTGIRIPDYDLTSVNSVLKTTFPIDDTSWWTRE